MLIINIKKAQYKNVCAIYKLYCDDSDKFYIGSTNNLQERLQAHRRALNKKSHYNIYLQRFCLKHNIDNLKFEILAKCPEEYLIKLEQWFINSLKPCLNISEKAERPPKNKRKGYKMSEQAKQNISNAKKGKKSNRENYKHTEETLNKISQSLKDRIITEEWKQKMKEAKVNGGKYSKLTIKQMKEIKLLVGTKTDKEIAYLFNVSRSTINQIKNNKIWTQIV